MSSVVWEENGKGESGDFWDGPIVYTLQHNNKKKNSETF